MDQDIKSNRLFNEINTTRPMLAGSESTATVLYSFYFKLSSAKSALAKETYLSPATTTIEIS